MGLYRLLRRLSLPAPAAALSSVFLMINYALLVGAGTSTVRAVTMFAILAYADTERRSYDLPTALLLAAASAALSNPYELLMSGFWLSYLAVVGIAVYFPALIEGIRLSTKRRQRILENVGGGLAVTLFTLPLILRYYYEAPVYAALLNLIVIPLMSVLMVCGLAALLLGAISPVAGIAAAYPCHQILALYQGLCGQIARLPGHSIIAGEPGTFRLLLAYGLLLSVLALSRRRIGWLWSSVHPRAAAIRRWLRIPTYRGARGEAWQRVPVWRLFALRLALSLAVLPLLFLRFRTGLTVTMLDVGQGDGICIETPGCSVMIDGGSTSKSELCRYQLAPFLKYRGIARVDYWYITHPDRDHTSGLIELLTDEQQTLRVGAIVLPDARGAAEDCAELIALAQARGVPVLWNSAGSVLERDGLRIACLHPRQGYETEDVNSYSQVLAVSGYGFCGVFTGDATVESETAILREIAAGELKEPRPEDGYLVLKLGHHGSSTSSSQEFLDYIQPRIALLSCGYQNRYGHPHEEVMERIGALGCAVYRTDQDGAVILRAREGRIRLRRWAVRE